CGNAIKDANGNPLSFGSGILREPMGIEVSSDWVFIGDNAPRRVLVFNQQDGFAFAGEAVGYEGPVAALAIDGRGHLLVHSGDGRAPFTLTLGQGFATRGVLWSVAIQVREFAVSWHRLKAVMTRKGSGAHIRLFFHASNNRADRPAVDPSGDDPFKDPRWLPSSSEIFPEIEDLFLGGLPAQFIWVGALVSGDGRSTPVLSQLKLEFDHQTYLSNLPAIYREESPCGDFLTRFVSLFETLFSGIEGTIESLAMFFDPAVVPPDFLPWLAGWLAVELEDDWDESKKRQAIARAFEAYGRRGTARGLREALLFLAGVDAIVDEPIVNAEWWGLPAESKSCGCDEKSTTKEKAWVDTENSVLGVTTMLAAAHPQGAVVGATATLDQSHLISNEELGAPLFMDLAHRFSVQVYRTQLNCIDSLARVREVIQREKPAHTEYHLCILEPRMRVGYQARLGIDTIVAGPSVPTGLGDERGTVLSGQPAAQIGETSVLGVSTRVG